MREVYVLIDPLTGKSQTVHTKIAYRALVGQGWRMVAAGGAPERSILDQVADEQ